jgi:hypothetical protein
MPIADERFSESPAFSRLLELVRRTKRYSLREVEPGKFEVIDDRYLLNRLLQFPELRPTTKLHGAWEVLGPISVGDAWLEK